MNLIDQYIESLSANLGQNVSQTREQVAEIHTHLEMDARDRVDAGATLEEAHLAACKAMGSPQIIAKQIIRQARGYATASAWRLSWVCGVFLTLAMAIPYTLLANYQYLQTADTLVRWGPFLALLFFGWRVVQTKRWLAKPMILWAALATAGALAGNVVITVPQPTQTQLEQGRASLRQSLAQVQSEQLLVDRWKNGSTPLDKAPFLGASSSTYIIPFVPFAIGGTDQSVSLEDSSPAEATTRWAKYGAMYAADVQDRQRYLSASLTGTATSTLSKSEIAMNMFKLWLMFTAYQTLVFFVVNAGLLALIRIREKRRTRREPLFA